MDNYTLNIKVNDGDVFDGDLSQWEDCFGFYCSPTNLSVNEKLDQIQDWCNFNKYNLTLSFKAVAAQNISATFS